MLFRSKRNHSKRLTSDLQAAVSYAGNLVQADTVSNKLAASSNKVGNDLVFNEGWVIKTKKLSWLGQKKNFYDVYNKKTGKTEARDLGLFMSAMLLVKMKTGHKSNRDIERIIDVDGRYQQHLNDAAIFGSKLRSKNVSSSKCDIYKIRMEEAMLQCQRAKEELRSYV